MFKFKKDKRETGLWLIGNPDVNTTIKLGSMKVGWINAPSWSTAQEWTIWMHVHGNRGNPNCDWHNKKLAVRFDTEPEAREWLKKNFAKVCSLGLHEMEID